MFFYAPLDADQGFVQKIFYVHVPLAIVSLCGFVLGGILAIVHLRTGDRKWDLRSYVAIHMSLIFGVGGLLTGSIWAKASWGHWWVWNDPTLVSFLIVVLLFATYQPLRFSIEDPSARRGTRACSRSSPARSCRSTSSPCGSRRASSTRGCSRSRGGNLPGLDAAHVHVSLIGIALLFATLCKFEMTAKRRADPGCGACAASCSATTRSDRSEGAPHPHDRCSPPPRAAAAHGRQVRRRRVHRVPACS